MKRECLLNADAVGKLSYCESLGDSAVLLLQNETFEYLDSFTIAFFDLDMYTYCVADTKSRDVISLIFLSD